MYIILTIMLCLRSAREYIEEPAGLGPDQSKQLQTLNEHIKDTFAQFRLLKNKLTATKC